MIKFWMNSSPPNNMGAFRSANYFCPDPLNTNNIATRSSIIFCYFHLHVIDYSNMAAHGLGDIRISMNLLVKGFTI